MRKFTSFFFRRKKRKPLELDNDIYMSINYKPMRVDDDNALYILDDNNNPIYPYNDGTINEIKDNVLYPELTHLTKVKAKDKELLDDLLKEFEKFLLNLKSLLKRFKHLFPMLGLNKLYRFLRASWLASNFRFLYISRSYRVCTL